jgi:hypothetical protein
MPKQSTLNGAAKSMNVAYDRLVHIPPDLVVTP